MSDFWHVQGRMDLREALQNGAKPEEDAIKEFYDYYTEALPLSLLPPHCLQPTTRCCLTRLSLFWCVCVWPTRQRG